METVSQVLSPPMTPVNFKNTVPDEEEKVHNLLQRVFGKKPITPGGPFIRAGMSVCELICLHKLVRQYQCQAALEIGMACGTSSVVIGAALQENGGGSLISVDPFQLTPEGYAGAGIQAMQTAGLLPFHRLIEQPNYLALPELLKDGRKFDFVFIDGWHSFDYTLLDIFYADLLLKEGGILALHDSTALPVFKAILFLEKNKPYTKLSPPLAVEVKSWFARLWRRVRTWVKGPQARSQAQQRREHWRMLAAYRKNASQQTPELLHDF